MDKIIPRFTVGRVLKHLEPGVTGVYDRYAYDDEKREALDGWSRLVVQGLVGGERPSRMVLKGPSPDEDWGEIITGRAERFAGG